MRIAEVLAQLSEEFPGITQSKLRFLEDQGLITPGRSASGYRSYTPEDVARLRLALKLQRDSYLPLKVIKAKLATLEMSQDPADDAPADQAREWTSAELAQACGVPVTQIEEFVAAGLLPPSDGERLPPEALTAARGLLRLAEFGIGVRHLRPLRAGAAREAALVQTALAAQRVPDPRETAVGLAEILALLHRHWLLAETLR